MLKIAAALALVALLTGIYFGIRHQGVVAGRAEVKAEWDADNDRRKVAEDKAIADRLRANELRVAQQESDKLKLKEGYANEIANIRANAFAAPKLRISTTTLCGGSPISPKADSAGGGNADASGSGLLPEPYSGDLRALADQADVMAASCRVAQDFIKKNGMAP